MAELKKYLDQAGLEALVAKIKSEDDAHQAAAQSYADGLAKNYDAAGSAATAKSEAVAYTDEKVGALADGQVKTNKEAIAAIVADYLKTSDKTELQGNIDVVAGKADANAEAIAAINNETTGILATAKAYTDTKDSAIEAAKKAGDDAQDAVDTLTAKVGTVPEGSTVMDIINNIQENAYDDTELRSLISGLDSNKADKTQVATDIETAVKVETDARVEAVQAVQDELDEFEGSYATDKEAMEGAIALKADQTALDSVSEVANAAVKQSDYNVKVKSLEDEDARIAGLVAAETERATGVEAGLEDRIETMEAFWEAAKADGDEGNVIDTLKEIQEYIAGDETGASEMLAAINKNKEDIATHVAIDHDFAGADATLKAELEGKINAKADASVVEELSGRVDTAEDDIDAVEGRLDTAEGEIDELQGQMTTVQGAVATKVEQEAYNTKIAALEGADTSQVERIVALEAKFGGAEGSVEDQINDAKEAAISAATDAAATDATEKANKALEDAKAYTNTEVAKDRARLDALETVDHEHSNKELLDTYTQTEANLADAVAKKHEHANAAELNKIVDGDVAKWNASEQNAKDYANGLNTAMTSKVDGIDSRLQTAEGAVSTKAEQEDLDDAVERIAANEAAVATNASAIAAFQAIPTTDIEALFA